MVDAGVGGGVGADGVGADLDGDGGGGGDEDVDGELVEGDLLDGVGRRARLVARCAVVVAGEVGVRFVVVDD